MAEKRSDLYIGVPKRAGFLAIGLVTCAGASAHGLTRSWKSSTQTDNPRAVASNKALEV